MKITPVAFYRVALAGLLVLAACSSASAADPSMVGLQQAFEQGEVSYRFEGSGTTVGGIFTLKNLTDRPIKVVIPTGTLFVPEDGESQPMVTGRNEPVELKPGGTWTGPLVTFCTDHFKPPPKPVDGGTPPTLGPRTLQTDGAAALVICRDEVRKSLAKETDREVGPWEKRDPERFWDTALLWAIYGKDQEIGQATFQETMENQFDDQVSAPRAKQEARALGDEVFTGVHMIEDRCKALEEEEVDLTDIDPTLKYRPPLAGKSASKVETGGDVSALLPEALAGPEEFAGAALNRVFEALREAFGPGELLAAEEAKDVDLSKVDPTHKYRSHKKPASGLKPGSKVKKAKVKRKEPTVGDAVPVATTIPKGPLVRAYMYMAADAHDRYKDLDSAEDWLERALEHEPYNKTARAMLDQVKAEKQQKGMQRMGVAVGVLQQMLEKMQEEEQQEEEGLAEEGGGGMGDEDAPPEDDEPPPEED